MSRSMEGAVQWACSVCPTGTKAQQATPSPEKHVCASAQAVALQVSQLLSCCKPWRGLLSQVMKPLLLSSLQTPLDRGSPHTPRYPSPPSHPGRPAPPPTLHTLCLPSASKAPALGCCLALTFICIQFIFECHPSRRPVGSVPVSCCSVL